MSGGGNSEHIWIQVQELLPDKIRGLLANDPVALGDLKAGTSVEISRDQVEDWVYTREGAPVGLFTVQILQELEREKARR